MRSTKRYATHVEYKIAHPSISPWSGVAARYRRDKMYKSIYRMSQNSLTFEEIKEGKILR